MPPKAVQKNDGPTGSGRVMRATKENRGCCKGFEKTEKAGNPPERNQWAGAEANIYETKIPHKERWGEGRKRAFWERLIAVHSEGNSGTPNKSSNAGRELLEKEKDKDLEGKGSKGGGGGSPYYRQKRSGRLVRKR